MAATTAIITSGKTRVRPRGGMTKKRALDWLLLAAVIVGALIVLVPFYRTIVTLGQNPARRRASSSEPDPSPAPSSRRRCGGRLR